MSREAIAATGEYGFGTLAQLLETQSRQDEAEQVARACVLEGDPAALSYLTYLLGTQGRDDEAEQLLRDAVAAGIHDARDQYLQWLDDHQRHDQAQHIRCVGPRPSR
jgi:hypothetical protein